MRAWIVVILLSGCIGGGSEDGAVQGGAQSPEGARPAAAGEVVGWINRTVYMQGAYDLGPLGRAHPGIFLDLPGGEALTGFWAKVDWTATPTATTQIRLDVFSHNRTTILEAGETWNQSFEPVHDRVALSFAPVATYGAAVGGPDFELHVSVRVTGQAAPP